MSLATPIQQYISKKYDQHPDMFRHDLEVINNLRRDAVNVREAHPSGIKKLQTYAGQLVWLGGKFPIDVNSPLSLSLSVRDRTVLIFAQCADRLAPTLRGTLRLVTIQSTPWCRTTSNMNS